MSPPRRPNERRRDWTKTFCMEDDSERSIDVECFAPVWRVDSTARHGHVQTWNELPIPSGLIDDSGGKEVWCLVSDPYLSVTRSFSDDRHRIVVARAFKNSIRIEN